MGKFNWFQKKAKGEEPSEVEVVRGIKGVFDIAPQEEIRINLWIHNVPAEKTKAYAEQIDRLFKIRGKSGSNNGSEWVEWVIDKLSVYLFTTQ